MASPSLATPQPSSTASSQGPVGNDEAVVSDNSLSQRNTPSIRSTPASSFSIQRSSPHPEALPSKLPSVEEITPLSGPGPRSESDGTNTQQQNRSSGLQPVQETDLPLTSNSDPALRASGQRVVEEIELTSIPSHEDPNQSDGINSRRQNRDEVIQRRNTPSTSASDYVGSGNTPQPLARHRSYAASFRGSLQTVYQYMPTYEITSNTMALLALVLTAFFGFETYRMTRTSLEITKVGTEAQLYQTCKDPMVVREYRACNMAQLTNALGDKELERDLQRCPEQAHWFALRSRGCKNLASCFWRSSSPSKPFCRKIFKRVPSSRHIPGVYLARSHDQRQLPH